MILIIARMGFIGLNTDDQGDWTYVEDVARGI
jgi:hypothetical protein